MTEALQRLIKAGRENLDVGPQLIAGKEGQDEGVDYDTDGYWDLESALDGVLGVEEWHSLAAAFERSLAFMPRVSDERFPLLLWTLLNLLLCVRADAPPVAPLSQHVHPPILPTDALLHARAQDVRQGTAHASWVATSPHLEILSQVGRKEGR